MSTAQCQQHSVLKRVVVMILLAAPVASMLSTFFPQTIPIVLELRGPCDAEVHIRWGDSPWHMLPLVPEKPPGSPSETLYWTGTLPSQPVERLWLRFGKGIDEATLVQLTVGRHPPQVWTAQTLLEGKAELTGLTVQEATQAELRLRVLSTPAEVLLPDFQPIRAHDARTALRLWLGVVLGLGVLASTMAYAYPRLTRLSNVQGALLLAGFFAALALLRDALLLWGFSYSFYPDSHLYVHLGSKLFDLSTRLPPAIVTLPYPLLHALTHSDVDPLGLIWLQIGLGALAVFALVYVLGHTNRLLAAGVGMVLALDVVWGLQNRTVLTEGPVTSFALLSVAWMLSHYERRQRVPHWELLLAGLLYGWTCSFRPNYLLLLLCIVPMYGWLSRSWRKLAWLLTGLLLVLGVSASLSLWRSGAFRVYGKAGYYVAFPLFTDQLFAPDNGPVSRHLQQDLQGCIPGFQPHAVTVANAHDYIMGQFMPCLTRTERREDAVWWRFTQAYMEAILHRPRDVVRVMIFKSAEMLAYELYWYPGLFMRAEGNSCGGFAFCAEVFVRRLSPDSLLIKGFEALAQATLQLYQIPGRVLWGAATMPTAQTRGWHALSWVLLVSTLLTVTRGHMRFLTGLSAGFTLSVLVSVAAGHFVQMRYALPLHPFYTMLSVVMILTLAQAMKCGIMRVMSSILPSLRRGERRLIAKRRRRGTHTPVSAPQK